MANSAKQQPSAQRGAKTRTIRTKSTREAWGSFYLAVMSGACTRGAVSCRTSLGSHLTFIRQAASQTSAIRVALFCKERERKINTKIIN